MKKYWIIILLAAMTISSCSVKPRAEGSVVVDMASKGRSSVPESMYGVFFEGINHAGDGGLYAELVQNRSFEEKEYPDRIFQRGKLDAPPSKNHLTGK